MHIGYYSGLHDSMEKGELKMEDLMFQDECPVYWGLAPRTGRSDQENIFMEEENKRGAGKLNLLATIGADGVYKVCITTENVDDAVFKSYMLEAQPNKVTIKKDRRDFDVDTPHIGGAALTELIPKGKILLLDRLGRAGRSKNPQKLHYNPDVRARFIEIDIGYDLLPPKGAEFNPTELFNGWVQRYVLLWIPDPDARDTFGQLVRGPRNREEAIRAVNDALAELNKEEYRSMFRYWYHRRATGADAFKRWCASAQAQQLREKRATDPNTQIYDIMSRAFRDKLFNIHADAEEDEVEEEEEREEEAAWDWAAAEAARSTIGDVDDVPVGLLASLFEEVGEVPRAGADSDRHTPGSGAAPSSERQNSAREATANDAGDVDDADDDDWAADGLAKLGLAAGHDGASENEGSSRWKSLLSRSLTETIARSVENFRTGLG